MLILYGVRTSRTTATVIIRKVYVFINDCLCKILLNCWSIWVSSNVICQGIKQFASEVENKERRCRWMGYNTHYGSHQTVSQCRRHLGILRGNGKLEGQITHCIGNRKRISERWTATGNHWKGLLKIKFDRES